MLTVAVSGQTRRPVKPVPAVLPLAPLEVAWTIDLPTPPSGGAALDATATYIPLEGGQLVALDRDSGATRWTIDAATRWPIVSNGRWLFIATPSDVRAVTPSSGAPAWRTDTGEATLAPLLVADRLLVLTASRGLVCLDVTDGAVRWTRMVSGESPGAGLVAGAGTGYLVFGHGVVQAFSLADGHVVWETTLTGPLGPASVGRDRVFVGSANNSLYALNSETGQVAWTLVTGGDIVGTAVDGETVYVTSLDNLLRAVRRSNGNQRWRQPITTRPAGPPVAMRGLVAQPGYRPALSTFSAVTGTPIGTYDAPSELQGAMLVDVRPVARRVGAVAVTREGQVVGLRSADLMLREPAQTPLTVLPGRVLSREAASLPR